MRKYKSQLIALLCIAINHIYMHLVVLDGTSLSAVWIYRAMTFLCFDVLLALLISGALAFFLFKRAAYTLAWGSMLVLDMINIAYSRFFHQYLSTGTLSESSNLTGMWWVSYILPACRITDLLLVLTSIVFLLVVWTPKRLKPLLGEQSWAKPFSWKSNLVAIFAIVLPHTVLSDVYNIRQHDFPHSVGEYLSAMQGDLFHHRVIMEQKLYYCAYGLFRTQQFFALFYPTSDKELTADENKSISDFLASAKQGPVYSGSFALPEKYNVSMIIVESYLSVVSDLAVGGAEVTPNLNKLRHLPGTYYNGTMSSSIALGESSDAQLMYFTGLLPLKSEITVSKLAHKHIPALPALMQKNKGYNTYMTIPTKKYVWHQDEASPAYGIGTLYSTLDEQDGFLSEDDQVFKLAMSKQSAMKQPFMHVVLTASMHSPYNNAKPCYEKCPLKFPADYSPEYCNYLRACWFMDSQIGVYIDNLKQSGLYDHTILVITSDHASHADLLNMPQSSIGNDRIPLYIVNANIQLPEGNDNNMQQIDVYSSLLDLFGINAKWRGLGQSIFRPRHAVNEQYIQKRQDISELIIKGDYLNVGLKEK